MALVRIFEVKYHLYHWLFLQLVWNPRPILHGLGLRFGVYSGGGYYQCGSTDLPASVGNMSITILLSLSNYLLGMLTASHRP
jgi:hypothetical protein